MISIFLETYRLSSAIVFLVLNMNAMLCLCWLDNIHHTSLLVLGTEGIKARCSAEGNK